MRRARKSQLIGNMYVSVSWSEPQRHKSSMHIQIIVFIAAQSHKNQYVHQPVYQLSLQQEGGCGILQN